MAQKDDGGPAFPNDGMDDEEDGMSLRQYAAIHLKQPTSGAGWLDEMIRSSQGDLTAKLVAALEAVELARMSDDPDHWQRASDLTDIALRAARSNGEG